jgi:hypothetical protein
MEPDMACALEAAQENSFLARLSLLDPRTLDPAAAEKISDLLDAGEVAASRHASGDGDDVTVSSEDDPVAVTAIHDLLRQLVYVDPNANMLANGVRPLVGGPRLSLHSSRVTALQFPMYVRGEDDSVVSSRGKLAVRDAATGSNPFFDGGVLKYYAKAGGAAPPTPWSSRKVIAAAVWYVCESAGVCDACESAGVCDACGVWRVSVVCLCPCLCWLICRQSLRVCVYVGAGSTTIPSSMWQA